MGNQFSACFGKNVTSCRSDIVKDSLCQNSSINKSKTDFNLKISQRQEKDLIERELAEKFTQQLHVDSNKYTGKYLEEDLEDLVEKDFPGKFIIKLKLMKSLRVTLSLFYLKDLTEDQIFQINNALINNPKDEVLVSAFSISICRKDVQTLYGLNWLNDEIINFYMSLICERSKSDQSQTYLKTHAFTTFFYPKLIKDGYTMLRRWTRKIDIFSFDLILIPLHLGLHWTLAVGFGIGNEASSIY